MTDAQKNRLRQMLIDKFKSYDAAGKVAGSAPPFLGVLIRVDDDQVFDLREEDIEGSRFFKNSHGFAWTLLPGESLFRLVLREGRFSMLLPYAARAIR